MKSPNPTVCRVSGGCLAGALAWVFGWAGVVVEADAAEEAATARVVGKPWSFAPVRDPEVPRVADAAWVRTPVDRFIRARMAVRGVEPAPEADRRTLIRRLTFDLTGLPPTPEEVRDFEADPEPGAYERLVERVLSSPHYGERWGRHWLDVVRYADTAGDTADYPVREAWRYRDWVIRAFNADLPYDQFLREQIAGDILADAGSRERYADQVTATGFLAISRRFGFDSENYHHLTLADTLDTLGQAVLGLSLGCARCHDHKYDPVTMTDYYALYGIFSSTRYPFPGSEQKGKSRAMVPLVPPAESQPAWERNDREVAALSASLARAKRPVPSATFRSLHDPDGDFEMQKEAAGGSYGVLVPPWWAEGDVGAKTTAQSPFRNRYPIGRVGASLAGGARDYRLEQALHPRRDSGSTPRIRVNVDFRVASTPDGPGAPHRFRLGPGPGEDGSVVELAIWPDALGVRRTEGSGWERVADLPTRGWHNLQLEIDLEHRQWHGVVTSTNGLSAPLPERRFPEGTEAAVGQVIWDSGARGAGELPGFDVDQFAVQLDPLRPATVVDEDPESTAAPTDSTSGELVRRLSQGPVPMAYAVVEGTPRDSRLQKRGEPDRPGDVVPRGFIRALGGGGLPPGTRGSGRLELAGWLTRADHPLTSRVMVNRIWQHHFGRGLVATPNDFGTRGRPPSDPDLLDHLASCFVKSGWSVKAMHRLLVESATYRQSTRSADAGEAADDTWSGFPRRRLDAEEVRDAILSVSGDLAEAPGSGHPFPSPTDVSYTQHGPFSAVYEHRHRSVYLMTQRLKRHPFLALFDGPDPNSSTAVRGGTTVPTQALFFLNDPFLHRQSARWAASLKAWPGGEDGQVSRAWQVAAGRKPTPGEQGEAREFLAMYRSEPGGDGDGVALAAYLRALLGSNEFLHVD